jgi:hypothetical protein
VCSSSLELPRSRWGHVSLAIGGFPSCLSCHWRVSFMSLLLLVDFLHTILATGGFHLCCSNGLWVALISVPFMSVPFMSPLSLVGSFYASLDTGRFPYVSLVITGFPHLLIGSGGRLHVHTSWWLMWDNLVVCAAIWTMFKAVTGRMRTLATWWRWLQLHGCEGYNYWMMWTIIF